MVGFNDTVPAIGDEDIREKLAGTWLYFFVFVKGVFLSVGM